MREEEWNLCCQIFWYGWHGFRRGLAMNLDKLGCPAKAAHAEMAKLGVAYRKSEKGAKQKSA
jgi:hypothetical protein